MKYWLYLILLLNVTFLSALVINHIPPSSFETDRTTELKIDVVQGMSYISEAQLMYRVQDSGDFKEVVMESEVPDGTVLIGLLPVTTTPSRGYEYYFRFVLIDGSTETVPIVEPEKNTYVIQPVIKPGDLTQDFILLSDVDSARSGAGLVVAVSWFALDGVIDASTINLILNEKNVTQQSYIGSYMLLYRDSSPKIGVNSYFVTAKTKDGQEFYSNTWTTVIEPGPGVSTLPLSLKGLFRTGTNVYATANDSTNTFGRDLDDGWADLELLGYHKDFRMQAYTHLSTKQDEDIQNVNKFKMAFMLPFWEVYLGDYSPNLSEYTMSNRNIRGIYTRLHSKNVGFSFVHGQIVRAIDGKAYTDSTTKATLYTPGVFKQETMAARLQFGPDDGLYFGLTTTRNRDVVSSLDDKYFVKITETDTTQFAFPRDNLVISMDSRLTIPRVNIIMGLEGAGSLYNSNIYPGAMSSSDLEDYLDTDIPIDPSDYQDIFIFNTNMQPIPMSKDFKTPRPFLAWKAYLRNYYLSNMLNFSYSEVGPSFHALSTNNQTQDVAQWLISDQYTYNQYLFLGGGFSRNKDNLTKSKLETNIYDNYYLQGMFRMRRYPYLLISFSNSHGVNEPNAEIESADVDLYTPYRRNSQMLAFTLGYEFTELPVAPTTVDFGYRNGRDYERRQEASKAYTKQYDYRSDNVSLSVYSRFIPFPLRTQFTISNSSHDNLVPDTENNNLNFLMKGEYWLFNNRVKPWAQYRVTGLSGDQDSQSFNYIDFGVEARPYYNTTISTNLGWQIYKNDDKNNVDYTTTAWHLLISQRF